MSWADAEWRQSLSNAAASKVAELEARNAQLGAENKAKHLAVQNMLQRAEKAENEIASRGHARAISTLEQKLLGANAEAQRAALEASNRAQQVEALRQDRDRLAEELDQTRKQTLATSTQVSRLRASAGKTTAARDTLQASFNQAKTEKERYEKQVHELESRVSYMASTSNVTRIEELKAKMFQQSETIQCLLAEKSQLRDQSVGAAANCEKYKVQLETVKAKLVAAETRLAREEELLESKQAELCSIKSKLHEATSGLDDALRRLSEAGATACTLEQQWSQEFACAQEMIQNQSEALQSAENTMREQKTELEACQRDIAVLHAAKDRGSASRNKLARELDQVRKTVLERTAECARHDADAQRLTAERDAALHQVSGQSSVMDEQREHGRMQSAQIDDLQTKLSDTTRTLEEEQEHRRNLSAELERANAEAEEAKCALAQEREQNEKTAADLQVTRAENNSLSKNLAEKDHALIASKTALSDQAKELVRSEASYKEYKSRLEDVHSDAAEGKTRTERLERELQEARKDHHTATMTLSVEQSRSQKLTQMLEEARSQTAKAQAELSTQSENAKAEARWLRTALTAVEGTSTTSQKERDALTQQLDKTAAEASLAQHELQQKSGSIDALQHKIDTLTGENQRLQTETRELKASAQQRESESTRELNITMRTVSALRDESAKATQQLFESEKVNAVEQQKAAMYLEEKTEAALKVKRLATELSELRAHEAEVTARFQSLKEVNSRLETSVQSMQLAEKQLESKHRIQLADTRASVELLQARIKTLQDKEAQQLTRIEELEVECDTAVRTGESKKDKDTQLQLQHDVSVEGMVARHTALATRLEKDLRQKENEIQYLRDSLQCAILKHGDTAKSLEASLQQAAEEASAPEKVIESRFQAQFDDANANSELLQTRIEELQVQHSGLLRRFTEVESERDCAREQLRELRERGNSVPVEVVVDQHTMTVQRLESELAMKADESCELRTQLEQAQFSHNDAIKRGQDALASAKTDIVTTQSQLGNAVREVEQLKSDRAKLKVETAALETTKAELGKTRAELKTLREVHHGATTQCTSLEQEVTALKLVNARVKQACDGAVAEASRKLDAAVKTATASHTESKSAEQEHATVMSRLQAELWQNSEALKGVKALLASAEANLEREQTERQSECANAARVAEAHAACKAELERKVSAVSTRLDGANKQLQALVQANQTALRDLTELQKDKQQLIADLDMANANVARSNENMQRMHAKKEGYKAKATTNGRQRDQIAKELSTVLRKNADSEKEFKATKTRLAEALGKAGQYAAAHKDISAQLDNLMLEKSKIEDYLADSREELTSKIYQMEQDSNSNTATWVARYEQSQHELEAAAIDLNEARNEKTRLEAAFAELGTTMQQRSADHDTEVEALHQKVSELVGLNQAQEEQVQSVQEYNSNFKRMLKVTKRDLHEALHEVEQLQADMKKASSAADAANVEQKRVLLQLAEAKEQMRVLEESRAGSASLAQAEKLNAQIDSLKSKLRMLDGKGLSARHQALETRHKRLEKEFAQAKREVAKTEQHNHELEKTVGLMRIDIDQKRRSLADTSACAEREVTGVQNKLGRAFAERDAGLEAADKAHSENSALRAQLEAKEDQMAQLRHALSNTKGELTTLSADAAAVRATNTAEVAALQAMHTSEIARFESLLNAADQNLKSTDGQLSEFKQLFEASRSLAADKESKIQSQDRDLQHQADDRARLVADVDAAKHSLEVVRTKLEAQRTDAAKKDAQLAELRYELGVAVGYRDTIEKREGLTRADAAREFASELSDLKIKHEAERSELQAAVLNAHAQTGSEIINLKQDLLTAEARGRSERTMLEQELGASIAEVANLQSQLQTQSSKINGLMLEVSTPQKDTAANEETDTAMHAKLIEVQNRLQSADAELSAQRQCLEEVQAEANRVPKLISHIVTLERQLSKLREQAETDAQIIAELGSQLEEMACLDDSGIADTGTGQVDAQVR